MNTTGSFRIAREYLGKQYLSFTYEELRNLPYIMYMNQNQMTFYTAAMTDVMLARRIRTFYQEAARWDPEGKPSEGSIDAAGLYYGVGLTIIII